MSCITWNARGLGNQRAFHELKRLVAEKSPSLLFICETKLRDYQCGWWKEALGFVGLFVVKCEGRSGGLMLMWKASVTVSVLSFSSGHIDSTIQHGDKHWRFTGFYGNPETSTRHLFWTVLSRLSAMQELRDLPWLVGGDFNEICFDTEKWGGNPRPLSQTRAFREALDVCSLQDLHGSGEFFTWVNRRSPNNLIFERLDRFEPYWATEEDITDVVRRGWDKTNRATTLSLRLKGCKDTLRTWANTWFGSISRQLRNKRTKLAQLRTHNQWQQSSGCIETLERQRKQRNQFLSCVPETVNEKINSVLGAPFSAADVRKAVFDMHPDKAPGPDGMSIFFFQKYWDVIGDEVTEVVLKILNDGVDIADWNATVVTLVPKTQNPMTLKDFRPISLCNVCYKIVARSLTNRLRPILKKTVNEFQSAFIPGRLISDNIILSFEALHWIRSRKHGQKGYGALKLDMSKAYDRVEWSFLESMMLQLGFSPSWVAKIMNCVRSVTYSFTLNGDIVGNFVPSRGLRQGDPLSPYLFVLCAHGLSCALLSLEERKVLTGVRISTSCPAITHLFFANDSLLFFRATMTDCEAIRNCLLSYERASRQLINFEKSSLSFSPNTDEQLAETIKDRLAISRVQGHDVYLGLPVLSTRNKKLQFRYLVDKVVQRIQGWGHKTFSVGGKETLIKAMLQSIPTYAMSCFRIPKSICKGGLGFRHLETFNRDFLAKQVLRIIVEPSSLVACVLKARYFRHQDIMTATLGNNPSYLWRSLLWSRQLLDCGLCWKVGDGTKIDVKEDRWIPRPGGKIALPRAQDNRMMVKDLIENGRWREPQIRELFPHHLVDDILAIPIATSQSEDHCFWFFNPRGKYTVRDGYRVATGFYDLPEFSSTSRMEDWWKFLWALSIPPKIRIFCWRVVLDTIPKEQNLLAHHVPSSGNCPLCHYSCDSSSHAVFMCLLIKPCWNGTSFWPTLKRVGHLSTIDIFIRMKENLSKIDFERFVVRAWATWNERLSLPEKSSASPLRLGWGHQKINLD
ncbi:uncharacterized protein LOC142523746 [Primulina tabacum]|uniref:uncharacterized protein LOC142523746 n=1 Tax=Primulina tabacum TaxID=48773 RepID=UPI003F5A0D50